jgi:hypothetical protein
MTLVEGKTTKAAAKKAAAPAAEKKG